MLACGDGAVLVLLEDARVCAAAAQELLSSVRVVAAAGAAGGCRH